MPFTAKEIENVAQAVLDYHMNTPEVRSQTLQDKPLLRALREKEKTFPGGKEEITVRVKGEYDTTIQGFEHDDTVTYRNPANLKTARYPWKLIHSGIEFTMHEMIKAGISIVDSTTGSGEVRHSENEKIVLVDLLKDKIEDMTEGTDRGMNRMFWQDGSQDAKEVPGITSFVHDDPTVPALVGGIDQSVHTWWQNRADTSINFNPASPDDLVIVKKLKSEWRQLRRYGGRPNLVLCGSDFLEALEDELLSKGQYTMEGWSHRRNTEASIADISFKGVRFEYDPTLDDMAKSKYCYVLDTRHIYPMVVQGENGKDHKPSRPEDKYVFYRARTWVGGLVCDQRNAQGVYAIT